MHFAGSFPASCDFSVLPCEPTGLCSSERIYPEKNRVGKSPQQCHMLCSCVLLAGLAASTSLCFVLKIHFKRFGWFRNDNRDSHPWCEGHWLCHTALSPVPQRCLTRHRFQCEELSSLVEGAQRALAQKSPGVRHLSTGVTTGWMGQQRAGDAHRFSPLQIPHSISTGTLQTGWLCLNE